MYPNFIRFEKKKIKKKRKRNKRKRTGSNPGDSRKHLVVQQDLLLTEPGRCTL